ncbi:MAG: hypothetical protein AB7F53_05785 [Nitrososphaeraceae archaeon]
MSWSYNKSSTGYQQVSPVKTNSIRTASFDQLDNNKTFTLSNNCFR